MKTKMGEIIIWQKDVEKRAYECECSVYKAALEVLARKFMRTVSGNQYLDKSFDKAIQYQIDYAMDRARKNLNRRKK